MRTGDHTGFSGGIIAEERPTSKTETRTPLKNKEIRDTGLVHFGHARGINRVDCKVHVDENGKYVVDSAIYPRTARRIMDGYVYVKKSRIYDE